jgi:hypothetical protein
MKVNRDFCVGRIAGISDISSYDYLESRYVNKFL